MRGAYVCSDRGVPIFGSKGCSLHVQEVTRAFEQRGIHISLFAAALGGSCPSDLEQVDRHRVKHAKLADRELREQSDIQDNVKTISELERCKPFDFVYERYSLWSHAGMTYAKEHQIPAILEVNAPLIEEQKRYRGLIDEHSAEQVSKRCFADASVILAVSSQVAEYVASFTEAQGKVHVLPNGVNTERFSQLDRASSLPHPFTVGFVGTLKPWHGVEKLLHAFAALHTTHPNSQLLIVGDGPQREAIESQIAALGLTHAVEMVGAIPIDQLPHYYQQMDVGIAPYPGDINFYFSPLKIYEYMAAGLPVIASDVGEISHLVEHEKSGLIYPASDIDQLTDALEHLLTHPLESRQLGSQARQVAIEQHSWQKRLEQVLEWAGLTSQLTAKG